MAWNTQQPGYWVETDASGKWLGMTMCQSLEAARANMARYTGNVRITVGTPGKKGYRVIETTCSACAEWKGVS